MVFIVLEQLKMIGRRKFIKCIFYLHVLFVCIIIHVNFTHICLVTYLMAIILFKGGKPLVLSILSVSINL